MTSQTKRRASADVEGGGGGGREGRGAAKAAKAQKHAEMERLIAAQSADDRRRLREELRTESGMIGESAKDIADPKKEALHQHIGRNEELSEKVAHMREAVQDAENYNQLTAGAVKQAETLGDSASRQKTGEDKGPEVQPDQITKETAKETEDIGAIRVKGMVGVMEKTFQRGQTERSQQTKEVPLANFLFDPTSFTQTVENLFDVSFLAKEDKAAVQLNEEGIPVVRPISAAAASRNVRKKTQAVLSLSMSEWQEMVEAFGVEKAAVPHREGELYKPDEMLKTIAERMV